MIRPGTFILLLVYRLEVEAERPDARGGP